MKKLIIAATAVAALTASSAFAAADASSSVTYEGTVANTCVLGALSAVGSSNSGTLSGTTVSFAAGTFADTTTAKLNANSQSLKFADSYCNYAHTVSLKSTNGGMVSTNNGAAAVVGGTFVKMVGYTATLGWASSASAPSLSVASSTASAAGAGTATDTDGIGGANRGDLTMDFTTTATTDPVLKGTYSETFTVQIGASL